MSLNTVKLVVLVCAWLCVYVIAYQTVLGGCLAGFGAAMLSESLLK